VTKNKVLHFQQLRIMLMDIVYQKSSYVFTIVLWTIIFSISPFIIQAQTTDTDDNNVQNTNQTALLTFSKDDTAIYIGNTFTLHLNVENITDLAGWQCNIVFDPNVLEAVEVTEGDFLKKGGGTTYFQASTIDNTVGTITDLVAARTSIGGVSGTGRLLSVTFKAKTIGNTQITVTNLHAGTGGISVTIPLTTPEIVITVEDQPILNIGDPTFSFFTEASPILVGDTFTLHLNVENITDLARWQCGIVFDPNVLEAVEVTEGDFLKEGDATTFFLESTIDNTAGKITGLDVVRLSRDGVSGTGRLLSVTFMAKAIGETQVSLTNLYAGTSKSVAIQINIPEIAITVSDVGSTRLYFSIDEIPVRVGDTFTLNLNIADVTNLAGWLCDIVFDPAALEAVEVIEGDFLKEADASTFFLKSTIDNAAGKINSLGAVRMSKSGVSDTGKLVSVTFVAKRLGETQVTITNLYAGSSDLITIPMHTPEYIITVEERVFQPWDVNQDGEVNIFDLMQVAQYLGEDASVNPQSDVNEDGTIGILDLIVVAQHIDESTISAPGKIANSSIDFANADLNNTALSATIRTWITHAQVENDGSIAFNKGIANLQKLLNSMTSIKTDLLPNYPNPFNPETWIPYQLMIPVNVTLTIYDVNGNNVRNFALGYQDVGIYKNRRRAVYWDGKNSLGETVASGVYFYTLTAGTFTATKKMLIRK